MPPLTRRPSLNPFPSNHDRPDHHCNRPDNHPLIHSSSNRDLARSRGGLPRWLPGTHSHFPVPAAKQIALSTLNRSKETNPAACHPEAARELRG